MGLWGSHELYSIFFALMEFYLKFSEEWGYKSLFKWSIIVKRWHCSVRKQSPLWWARDTFSDSRTVSVLSLCTPASAQGGTARLGAEHCFGNLRSRSISSLPILFALAVTGAKSSHSGAADLLKLDRLKDKGPVAHSQTCTSRSQCSCSWGKMPLKMPNTELTAWCPACPLEDHLMREGMMAGFAFAE